jgi:hypothetical protein
MPGGMTRFGKLPVRSSAFLALSLLCLNAQAAAPDFAPLTVQGCGKPISVELVEPEKVKKAGIDIALFRKNEAASYARALEAICKAEPKYRELAQQNVRKIQLVADPGATEPTPYLDGAVLIIEFAGGAFDAREFASELKRAIEGLPPEDAD